jgi:hypothetical protein
MNSGLAERSARSKAGVLSQTSCQRRCMAPSATRRVKAGRKAGTASLL